jgi:hypothetical protein
MQQQQAAGSNMKVTSLVTTDTRIVGTGEALRSVKTSCHMTKNAITRYFSCRLPGVYTGEARHDTGARRKLALNQHSCQVALILHLVAATSCHTLHGKEAPLLDCKASAGYELCFSYLTWLHAGGALKTKRKHTL